MRASLAVARAELNGDATWKILPSLRNQGEAACCVDALQISSFMFEEFCLRICSSAAARRCR
jgi:hypothetical protein